MRFTSTRNKSISVSFSQAVLDCMPDDGGLYVPFETEDLRRWVLYTDENTTFQSIAGSLTSAFIRDEFSPIICETIVSKAFKFAPEIKMLDKNLFLLELFHGPTGIHKDFGISYLVSCIETIFNLKGGRATFLDISTGELGASLAHALKGKKNIKAVLLYPKGTVRGLSDEDLFWNGGNMLPIEIDGTEEDCHAIMREIYADKTFARDAFLTVANTANIGRLLPQAFFYPFAFSRIKNKVNSSIFYSLAPGNYSNVVAGLYAWQFALPLNGFVLPETNALSTKPSGEPNLLDSIVPFKQRKPVDPSEPLNLERLENIFSANSTMMRHFIFPMPIDENEVNAAAKELFLKYNVLADRHTARAYASSKNYALSKSDEMGTTVLVARDSPALSAEFVRHTIGETPKMNENIKKSFEKIDLKRPYIKSINEVKAIIKSIK